MKPMAGGFCPLPAGSAIAPAKVKRRIHLDAQLSGAPKILSFMINGLRNDRRKAQNRGNLLKPFCNLALNSFGRTSPTELPTALVDNAGPAARLPTLP